MTKATRVILLAGIALCVICTLFPPRRNNNPTRFEFDARWRGDVATLDIPHAFLFSPGFGIYRHPESGMKFPVEVDGGRLLAYLVLIGSLTGGVILIRSLAPHKMHEN